MSTTPDPGFLVDICQEVKQLKEALSTARELTDGYRTESTRLREAVRSAVLVLRKIEFSDVANEARTILNGALDGKDSTP
jgi:hypothetical protein